MNRGERAKGANWGEHAPASEGRKGEMPSKASPSPLPTPPTDHPATTQRIVSNNRLLDPDIAAWARACRDVFGPGVKLYPDRYAHLWGGK